MLTGRGGELDRIRGFERGCDDYVVKPFSYPELRARIGALLGRTRSVAGSGRLRVGPLELDPLSRQVELDGRPIHLSKKEFALLRALAEEPTRVFTREELLRGVWGFRSLGTTRTLDRTHRDCARSSARRVAASWSTCGASGTGSSTAGSSDGRSRVGDRMSVAAACAGWLIAAVVAALWLLAHRALGARMEAVARACHELRGPITAARIGLEFGSRRGALSSSQLHAIHSELGRATLALEDLAAAPEGRTVVAAARSHRPRRLAV